MLRRTKFLYRIIINRIVFILTSPKFTYFIGEIIFWILGRRWNKKEIVLSHLRRVLVVRLDEIGDVVLTTPFLRELRKNLPHAWITLVVKPEVFNLVELCPYINEVLVYDRMLFSSFTNLRRHFHALKFAIFYLWKRKFDLAILPRWDIDWRYASFLIYFSGSRLRIGYSENVSSAKHKENKHYDTLFTHLIIDKILKHEVERNLEFIRFIGGEVERDNLELWVNKDDLDFAQIFLQQCNINTSFFLILISPATQENKRNWPKENFLKLIDCLIEETHSKIVLLGHENERFAGTYIQENIKQECISKVINKMGETTLRQTAALFKYSRLYIGNDSGVMHIASAMNIPVVEISSWSSSGNRFSANSPFRFGPWGVKNIVVNPIEPLSPCKDECVSSEPHCITQVKVEDVKKAAKELLFSRRDFSN